MRMPDESACVQRRTLGGALRGPPFELLCGRATRGILDRRRRPIQVRW